MRRNSIPALPGEVVMPVASRFSLPHGIKLAGFLFGLAMALTGCISNQPYHVQADPQRQDIPARMTQTNQDEQQFQRKYPVVPIQCSRAGQPLLVNGRPQVQPKLRFIEFDDQGEFFDRRQLNAAIADIRDHPNKKVVIVYIHGWQNRGEILGDFAIYGSSDGDAQRFKNFLVALANTEQVRNKREVIGIYASWRGELIGKIGGNFVTDLPVLLPRALTYYGRRAAATRIGSSTAMGEMLIAIRAAARMEEGSVALPTTPNIRDRAVTVFMGHSFGARVLEAAALQEFVRRSAKFTASNDASSQRVKNYDLPRYADLILFVNPADESLYAKRICEALTPDSPTDFPKKDPAIVALCSVTDSATRKVMPAADSIPAAFIGYRGRDMPYLEQGEFAGLSQKDFSVLSAPNNTYLRNGSVGPSPAPVARKAAAAHKAAPPNDLERAVDSIDHNLQPGSIMAGPPRLTDDKGQDFQINFNPQSANRTQYWALLVDSKLMDGHGDVWSPAAFGLYARLFRLAVPAAFVLEQQRPSTPLKTQMIKTLPPPPPKKS
jgi:hypothetical protein